MTLYHKLIPVTDNIYFLGIMMRTPCVALQGREELNLMIPLPGRALFNHTLPRGFYFAVYFRGQIRDDLLLGKLDGVGPVDNKPSTD